jgi:hypothetical protein
MAWSFYKASTTSRTRSKVWPAMGSGQAGVVSFVDGWGDNGSAREDLRRHGSDLLWC